MNVDKELVEDALDYLYSLKGEWEWKKDEPRAGNQAEYNALSACIFKLQTEVVKQFPNASQKAN